MPQNLFPRSPEKGKRRRKNSQFIASTIEKFLFYQDNSIATKVSKPAAMDAITVDSRLSYRIGSPYPLPVLPVETERVAKNTEAFQSYQEHHDSILSILDQEDVAVIATGLVHRMHTGDAPSNDNATVIILSDAKKGSDVPVKWERAVCKIREFLLHKGINIRVEIIDYQAYVGAIASPILHEHTDVIKGWGKATEKVFETIKNKKWLSVDILHCGLRDPVGHSPTVVISAQDADDEDWWTNIIPIVRSKAPGFDVELRYATSVLQPAANSDDQEGLERTVTAKSYDKNVWMGASCGPKEIGSGVTGTIGGALELSKNGETFNCAITCHHVLFDLDGFPRHNSHIDKAHWVYPLPPSRAKDLNLEVGSPSDVDHQQLGRSNLHKIQIHSSEPLKEEQEWIKTANRTLGMVWASSGFRDSDTAGVIEPPTHRMACGWYAVGCRWALDWSLVLVDEERSIQFEIPAIPSPIAQEMKHLKAGMIIKWWKFLDDYASYEVAKLGRTTGWTRGVISALPSYLNPPIRDQSPEQQELPSIVSKLDRPNTFRDNGADIMSCAAILPPVAATDHWSKLSEGDVLTYLFRQPKPPKNPNESLQQREEIAGESTVKIVEAEDFMLEGDSGCQILYDEFEGPIDGGDKAPDNNHASVLGIGFATSNHYRISYMIPMEIIIRDIKLLTGADVMRPMEGGHAIPSNRARTSGNHARS